jgi:hypothetical protein
MYKGSPRVRVDYTFGYFWDYQGGRCAICGREVDIKKIVIDHCHRTGFIRGLLCPSCNVREGLCGPDGNFTIRMYRQINSAFINNVHTKFISGVKVLRA